MRHMVSVSFCKLKIPQVSTPCFWFFILNSTAIAIWFPLLTRTGITFGADVLRLKQTLVEHLGRIRWWTIFALKVLFSNAVLNVHSISEKKFILFFSKQLLLVAPFWKRRYLRPLVQCTVIFLKLCKLQHGSGWTCIDTWLYSVYNSRHSIKEKSFSLFNTVPSVCKFNHEEGTSSKTSVNIFIWDVFTNFK